MLNTSLVEDVKYLFYHLEVYPELYLVIVLEQQTVRILIIEQYFGLGRALCTTVVVYYGVTLLAVPA